MLLSCIGWRVVVSSVTVPVSLWKGMQVSSTMCFKMPMRSELSEGGMQPSKMVQADQNVVTGKGSADFCLTEKKHGTSLRFCHWPSIY